MIDQDILDKYDFNVYIVDGEIGLYAYRQKYQTHSSTKTGVLRYVECDTSNYTSVKFPLTVQYAEEIAYLLDNEEWLDQDPDGWEEYDDWVGPEYLTRAEIPAIIYSYLAHLPNYELE